MQKGTVGMRTDNLLVEIGTEELPPKSLAKLAKAFADNTRAELAKAEFPFREICWYATPRRIAIKIDGLAEQQSDKLIEKRGPAVSAAFDEAGKATKAAEGWARSNGIEASQAERLVTDKGEWLLYKCEVKGKNISSLIESIVCSALAKLPIPKPMRWGANSTQFIRPVHTVTMLYADQVLPGSVLGVTSARKVMGHRFHGQKHFELNHADDYLPMLEKHFVLADFEQRKSKIRREIELAAGSANATADTSEALLDEVTSLVEWPVVLSASFDESFLAVPKEALIYTMKDDQKYFPLLGKNGQLLSRFVFVSNIESKDPRQVIEGNEKVIRPRLADAEFFFKTDKKHSLESRLDSLKSVLFQKQLGTLHEKSLRIASLARDIALSLQVDGELAYRAGLLSKTDLMTDMVMEFPDVQGVMGMHYARHDGEAEEVALAQNEQYMPRFSGDKLPKSLISSSVALADKIDSLVGIFGIGQIPKGDKDPFALRRSAIGTLRIIVELDLPLDLRDLVNTSASLFADKITAKGLEETVVDFILARFKAWYQEQGVDIDVIQAVAAKRPTRPADFAARVQAVSAFKRLESSTALAAANKRVANILAKNPVSSQNDVIADLLVEAEEKELASQLIAIDKIVQPLLANSDYSGALKELATLRKPIDMFFDNVMVMADDEATKNNRLALLSKLRSLFLYSADISLLNQ
ncbi:MAG: glycyl-tRNA synthetase beta chain [Paraglaciecola sp.]